MISLLLSAVLAQAPAYYSPTEAEALFNASNDAYAREDYAKAKEGFEKLVAHGYGSGDVLYNQCHMYVADTTPDSRENWIAALDRLAALNPKIAVAGHKKTGTPDTPRAIEATKRYLRDFGRLQESTSSDQELYDAMTELYPDWVSHQAWLMFK